MNRDALSSETPPPPPPPRFVATLVVELRLWDELPDADVLAFVERALEQYRRVYPAGIAGATVGWKE